MKNALQPPASPDAEKRVLGAIFWKPDLVHDITEKLTVEDFFWGNHKHVFSAIKAVHGRKENVNMDALVDELERAGKLFDIGGLGALAGLSEFGLEHASIQTNIAIVRRKAAHRRMIAAAQRIVQIGMEDGEDERLSFAEAQKLLSDADRGSDDDREYSMKRMSDEFYEDYANAKDGHGRDFVGISTAIPPLDQILQGMHGGEMIVVAGRSSMGKTAFGVALAHNVAEQGKRVMVFSYEMTALELYRRVMASRAQVDSYKLRSGRTDEWEDKRVSAQLEKITVVPMMVIRANGMDMRAIRSRVLLQQAKTGVDMIVIDYIGLVATFGFKDRTQAVGAVSRACKDLASECNIPVIALSQINRENEKRTEKRPMLSEMRESGSIEQDADVAMLLYRPWYYDKDADPLLTEVNVAKHRNGPTGMVEIDYDPATSTFAQRGQLPSVRTPVQASTTHFPPL